MNPPRRRYVRIRVGLLSDSESNRSHRAASFGRVHKNGRASTSTVPLHSRPAIFVVNFSRQERKNQDYRSSSPLAPGRRWTKALSSALLRRPPQAKIDLVATCSALLGRPCKARLVCIISSAAGFKNSARCRDIRFKKQLINSALEAAKTQLGEQRLAMEAEAIIWGDDLHYYHTTTPGLANAWPALPSPPPPPPPTSSGDAYDLLDRDEEEKRIKAFVETTALDWQRQVQAAQQRKGFKRGVIMGGAARSHQWLRPPPEGYVCNRCNEPGHFIQYCPTNGDPAYDVKRVRPPTGIPRSMLTVTPDGSYALPSGKMAALEPDEAAFKKEMEGLPSSARPPVITVEAVAEIPPELHCLWCKDVMMDAVMTTKCCFRSYCDACIRGHIISNNRRCICGATGILADDLVVNRTLRALISRILECSNPTTTTTGSSGVTFDLEGM